MGSPQPYYNKEARREMRRQAWIRNVVKNLGYTQEQAEQAYDRIQPYETQHLIDSSAHCSDEIKPITVSPCREIYNQFE